MCIIYKHWVTPYNDWIVPLSPYNDWIIPLSPYNDWVIPLCPDYPLRKDNNFVFYRPWSTVDKSSSSDIPLDPKRLYKNMDLYNKLEEEEDDE